ncbi:MAG: hypothetical protein WA463_12415 [Terriglobales bacterium]
MRSLGFMVDHLGRIALLVSLTAMAAQAQAPAGQQATQVTVRGCLQKGAAGITLTDGTGTTYLLDYASMSPQGSAFVEVHGVQFAPNGQEGEAALPKIRVDTMRRLSDICPEKIMAPPSTAMPPSPSAQSPSTPDYQSPIAPDGEEAAPVLNSQGAGGAPSPGTGNPPDQQTDKK